MARTALAIQNADSDGLVAAYTAANAAGHSIDPDGILHVKNDAVGSIDVTLVTPETRGGGLAVADRVIAVAAGAETFIFVPRDERESFAQPDGTVNVDFSAVTTVTVALIGRG